jgi:hypothetical protein
LCHKGRCRARFRISDFGFRIFHPLVRCRFRISDFGFPPTSSIRDHDTRETRGFLCHQKTGMRTVCWTHQSARSVCDEVMNCWEKNRMDREAIRARRRRRARVGGTTN